MVNIRITLREIVKKLQKFNLYPSIPPSTDEYQLRTERITTRVFIILLTLSLFIILLYHSLIKITKTDVHKTPTLEKYERFYSLYPNTLTCPCKNILVPYAEIVEIKYSLHEVCSSDLVTQRWFQYLLNSRDESRTYENDFRSTGSFTFQALGGLCQLANQTIADSYSQFLLNQYISATIASRVLLVSEVKILIGQFLSSSTNSFLRSLNMIRSTIFINAFYSERKTNYLLQILKIVGLHLIESPVRYADCRCDLSFKCSAPSSIYEKHNQPPVFTIPGLYRGCYIMEALLQSNLECFYNQTCVRQLQSHINSTVEFSLTTLHNQNSSKYSINSTIERILTELMIEEWEASIDYEKYYKLCEPFECSYSYRTSNEKVYIVTASFGLAGGLVTVLNVIVPALVKFIRRKKQPSTSNRQIRPKWTCLGLIRKLYQYLGTLNLFESIPPSTDEYQLRTERITTRVFIILLTFSLSLILLYHSLIETTKTDAHKTPTLEKYERFYSLYPNTLTCPCKNILIRYTEIVEIKYSLHEVCSSDLVTQRWFQYLLNHHGADELYKQSFFYIVVYLFQALDTLCQLANQTIADSYSEFLLREHISTVMTSSKPFKTQIHTFIEQLRPTIRSSFLRSLDLIRHTVYTNFLLSTRSTRLNFVINGRENRIISAKRTISANCSCEKSSTCIAPLVDYNAGTNMTNFTIPGLYDGCYIMEALLQSNLKCFYNQSCVHQLQSYIKSTTKFNFTLLHNQNNSKYPINSTIEQMLTELMVEEWEASIDYEKYYKLCEPIECSYSYQTSNEKVYIVTASFGLAGGLVSVLKIGVPIVIRLFRKKNSASTTPAEVDVNTRNVAFYQNIYFFIRNFNLFPSIPPSTSEKDLKYERLSTRIFLVLLTFTVAILSLYNVLLVAITIDRPPHPTLEEYEGLYSIYSSSLLCPCKNILIDYENILHVDYTLHEVCSSHFMNRSWLDQVYTLGFFEMMKREDFRISGHYLFMGLSSLCQLVNRTIAESYAQFLSNQYLSTTVVSSELFKSQMETLVEQFRSTITNNFLYLIHMVRQTTHTNAFYSSLITNYDLYVDSVNLRIATRTTVYDECRCDLSSSCNVDYPIYDLITKNVTYSVPGLKRGCYTLDALLQSNLGCLYNTTCLKELKSHYVFGSDRETPIKPLNPLLSSKYTPNSTIEQILRKLMIEEWNPFIKYDKYYSQCQPIECIHGYQIRYGLIPIITLLIGLVGGLISVLKLVVPRFVAVLRWIITILKNRRILPETSSSNE
ncbi:unnamed protein product [Adineta ricciae]|uniref:Uncharacterized protein n=1 Tax=Adineta ricciae TaxID=249248 RepID=A0A814MS89_ADIRI|nr:unnamed protein product [Adineta ricciae]CAF1198890.1 unnamed protein product [Adineta ricciae]